MMARHELPTHLAVEDHVLGNLTMRQLVVLLSGLSGAYALWVQVPGLPPQLRTALAAVLVLGTLALALLRPAGHSLSAWALVLLRYAALPKRSVWRPRSAPADPTPAGAWTPLAPSLAWAADPSAVPAGAA
jgi:hypothetical protein